MEQPIRLGRLWAVLGLLVAVLVLAVARPFVVALRCYELAASGERADAEIVGKDEEVGLVLRVASGTQEGQSCTAGASKAIYAAARPGDVLAVALRPEQPGECVLASTVEASGALLAMLGVAFGGILLLIVLLGTFVYRSYAASPLLTSHLEVEPTDMKCPRCGSAMAEGYLPLVAGLHWRVIGQPIGLPHALGGLPGTVGWRGRPRLHAYRCRPCGVITFRYGAG